MSQDYTRAGEKAEFLGSPIPGEGEWKAQAKNNDGGNDAAVQNLDSSNEAAQGTTGALDKLVSIVSATQKKINEFKNVLLTLKPGEQNRNETKNAEGMAADEMGHDK